MPGTAEDFGIWKKAVSRDSCREEGRRYRPVGVYEMCCAFVEEIVSLSLLMSKNLKLKKVNKSFVPEPVSCFSDSYMRMNIMNVLCMWISWSYFWWTYLYYKTSSYIYIKSIWFGLVGFYGILTFDGYLMPNHLYTYILDIYNLVLLGFMAY